MLAGSRVWAPLCACAALTTQGCGGGVERAEPVGASVKTPVAWVKLPAAKQKPEPAPPPPTPVAPKPCDGVDAATPEVVVHEADAWLCRPGAAAEQLTTTGDVLSAALSPNRARVALVRHLGKVKARLGGVGFQAAPADDAEASEIDDDRIYLLDLTSAPATTPPEVGDAGADAAPTRARELVEVAKNGVCLSLGAPDFAFDDGLVVPSYGYGGGTIHNRFVCFVDLKTKRTTMLGQHTTCSVVIRKGRYAGALFVPRARFKVAGGLIDDLVVIDRRGVVLRSFDEHPFKVDLDGDGEVAQDEGFCPAEKYRAKIDELTAKW